jgi:hypothetical protein
LKAAATGTVVYVLTSDGQDGYADMHLVSLWSLLESNPGRSVVVLVDSVSSERLGKCAHPILSSEAEIRVIPCEEGPGGWRNRFVKTQVRKHVPARCSIWTGTRSFGVTWQTCFGWMPWWRASRTTTAWGLPRRSQRARGISWPGTGGR